MRAYERLVRYVQVHTASAEDTSITPTTERQFDLSRLLAKEMEELGMEALDLRYLNSHYYEPSETLMLNYSVTVEETEPTPNREVDSWRWFPIVEARRVVRPGGLAERLLKDWP